jgi:hypothetical protein
MKASEIFSQINLPELLKNEEFDPISRETLSNSISNGELERLALQNGNFDEYPRDSILGLLKFRADNLAKQSREIHGFDIAIDRISKLQNTSSISWVPTSGREYISVLLIDCEGGLVVGILAIKKNSTQKKMKTPPNWDGSLEELHKFNEAKD